MEVEKLIEECYISYINSTKGFNDPECILMHPETLERFVLEIEMKLTTKFKRPLKNLTFRGIKIYRTEDIEYNKMIMK